MVSCSMVNSLSSAADGEHSACTNAFFRRLTINVDLNGIPIQRPYHGLSTTCNV